MLRYAAGLFAGVALTAGVALGQAAFTEGYLPPFSRTVKPAARERVKLTNDYPAEMPLADYPVTFGVAFPRGALRSADNARVVTQAGQEVPCQVLRTATWLAPDGDVKWLLFDMTARKGEEYAVEFGTQVRRASADSPMKVTDAAGRIEVNTGPLRVAFDKAQSHLLAGAWLDGKPVLAAGQRMYMVDQNGARYETSDKPGDYRVEVEASGPRAAIVKASGWYRDSAGKGLCEYVTRVHLYAGAPFLRVIHTFVVNYDTDKTWLTDVGVPFALASGPARKATFATETGFGAATFDASPGARLIQTATNNWVIQDAAGKTLREGKRVGGWVDLATDSGGVVVGLRHMWQEHQKELETLPGGAVAHLWPAHSGKALDFRAPQLYGPERYARLDGVYWQKWYVGGLDQYDQAMGLAKTNEMIVAFYGAQSGPARAACASQEKPPFMVADPKWMCATDAFGPLHPRDTERFADVEAAYDAAFDRFRFLRDNLDNYGFVEYGDVNYHVSWSEEQKKYVEGKWRRTASRFYGISLMPWIQFVRTGRRDYLAWAVDSAKHVMDIDMCHVDAKVEGYPYPKYKGGRYGGNGGIIHYGADIYDIGCDSHVTPWLYFYYLTGYRRAWDIFQEEGEFNLKLGKPGGRPSPHLSNYAHRMTGGALRVMIQYWWATWDKRYLDNARKLADLCYDAAKKSNGVIRHDDVYMNAGMVTYYQATGDPRMKEVFLTSMKEIEGGTMTLADPRAYSFYGPAMAYYFTGDKQFLARPYYWLRQYVTEVDVGTDPVKRGQPKGRWDMCHNTVHMVHSPFLLGALATVKEPPKPPADPDNSATGGEIWMENPDGRAFEVDVKWNCYARPYFTGPSFLNWAAWAKRAKIGGDIVVIGPDGAVAAKAAMSFADKATEQTLRLAVAKGKPGVYRVAALGVEGFPVKLALASHPFAHWGYPIADSGLCQAQNLYFRVPGGAKKLKLRFKHLALRVALTTELQDSTGKTLKSESQQIGSMPSDKWTAWEADVPSGEAGKTWRLKVSPLSGNHQETLVRIEGVAVASPKPEAVFVPSSTPAPLARPGAALPPGCAGPVVSVAAGKSHAIERGAKTAQGGYARINPVQGTLEFWIKPGWSEEDLVDSTFVKCGKMSIFRRSQIGTYVSNDKASIQGGFILRPGVWRHVAVTWDQNAKDQAQSLQLFIDGVKIGTLMGQKGPGNADWTGPKLEFGAAGAMQLAGIRIWAAPRVKELGQGKLSAKPDAGTLFAE